MHYLVTDSEDKSWKDKLWTENCSHTEENPNYQSFLFDSSPLLAAFLAQAYDRNLSNEIKIYEAEGEDLVIEQPFRKLFKKITCTKQANINLPNKQQRIYFGIISTLYVVENISFRNWAANYLKNIDVTPETANKTNQKIYQEYFQEDYPYPTLDSSHTILQAIIDDEKSYLMAGMAAHRAYYEALDMNIPIDLQQIADIVMVLSGQEIADTLL